MQSKQRWNKDKGGVIGEDNVFIISMSTEDSWWDDADEDDEEQIDRKVAVDTSKKKKNDTKNVVTREVPDVEDNETLPSLHTKAGEDE